VSRYEGKWPPSEENLADEFATFFLLDLVVLEESLALCKRLGIHVSFAPLPEGLHGINGSHCQNREVLLSTKEAFPGGKFHTLLHELRELLEYAFCDLGYPIVRNQELETHAEEFAAIARMNGAKRVFEFLFEGASKVETNWKRWLAIAAGVFIGYAYAFCCCMHSGLEDAMIRYRQKALR
jgi:hypothetical protein